MWRIFYPLRYFRLEAEGKAKLDLIPTVILTALIAVPYIVFGGVFFGQDGFVHSMVNVTAALGGFYVAALVAAATFSHPDLDNVIKSGPIALISRDADGQKVSDFLTRRELACMMFGYLAFTSILFSILGAVAVGLSRDTTMPIALTGLVGETTMWAARSVTIIGFSLVISHIATVTAVGLYYLMDRLYRHDRKITTKKGGGRIDDVA